MVDDPLAPEDEPLDYRFTSNYSPEFDVYYFALGQLAVIWAEFEHNLNDAIWELANVTRLAGTCMTSQLIGPGPRFRCLVSLLNLREVPPELVKAINSLSSEADSLGRQRNRFLHDPMVLNKVDKSTHRMETTADRTIKHGLIPIRKDEIVDLTGKIDSLSARFYDLYSRVLAETPPWPRTQYERSKGIRRERRPPTPDNSPLTPEHPPQSSGT
jgi:hypothetical protein